MPIDEPNERFFEHGILVVFREIIFRRNGQPNKRIHKRFNTIRDGYLTIVTFLNTIEYHYRTFVSKIQHVPVTAVYFTFFVNIFF